MVSSNGEIGEMAVSTQPAPAKPVIWLLRKRTAIWILLVATSILACEDARAHPGAVRVGDGLVADDQDVSFGVPEWEREKPALPERPITSIASSRQLGTDEDFGLVTVISPVGPLLLVGDELMDPHIAVIDIAAGKVTSRIGRDGEGPGEFQVPHMIAPDLQRPSVRWVFDFHNVRWSSVSLDGSPSIVEERSLAGGADVA